MCVCDLVYADDTPTDQQTIYMYMRMCSIFVHFQMTNIRIDNTFIHMHTFVVVFCRFLFVRSFIQFVHRRMHKLTASIFISYWFSFKLFTISISKISSLVESSLYYQEKYQIQRQQIITTTTATATTTHAQLPSAVIRFNQDHSFNSIEYAIACDYDLWIGLSNMCLVYTLLTQHTHSLTQRIWSNLMLKYAF